MDNIVNNSTYIHVKEGNLEYIQFSPFKKYDSIITHCFTTRRGGVSEGECKSLNLGFNRNDLRENVLQNYKIIARALDIDINNMVLSNQVHDIKIKSVDESDRGKGITRESDIKGYDGLMTDKNEVALVTFYADCVPIFFLDPVKRVIALSHSGWRGTVKKIGEATIKNMQYKYGTSPKDVIAAIGPSIGGCCFEVGSEVYEEFKNTLPWCDYLCKKVNNDKWNIDLKEIIRVTLIEAGVKEENISNCKICTKCNKDIFFSHRGDQGKTGSLAAIMQLRNI